MLRMRTLLLTLAFVLSSAGARAANNLQIYFIDVEGGQSTLFVAPSGQSMLVDTGEVAFDGRDPGRIAAVAKVAGIKQIDFVVITHFHSDHVGGVPKLAELIPIKTFVDHGTTVEHDAKGEELFTSYKAASSKGKRLVVKPGDHVPIRGIDVTVVCAAGKDISKPLPGGGQANPACASTPKKEMDPGENAQSLGTMITYGKFRMIDLGDLTWNKELELVCPNNKLGTVDVYHSTHHGLNISGSAAIVHALHPVVAVVNNSATKGNTPEAYQAIHSSPGLEDIWQLHYSEANGKALNTSDDHIANLQEAEPANYIKVSAKPSGEFTVTNSRNGKTKTYQSRPH